jgi:hypothetical protein
MGPGIAELFPASWLAGDPGTTRTLAARALAEFRHAAHTCQGEACASAFAGPVRALEAAPKAEGNFPL